MKKKVIREKEFVDYYEILGVSKNASQKAIQKAFRKLAMRYHPDKNHDTAAAQKFIEVVKAYEQLRTEEKRNEVDAKIISEFCMSLVPTIKFSKKIFSRHNTSGDSGNKLKIE